MDWYPFWGAAWNLVLEIANYDYPSGTLKEPSGCKQMANRTSLAQGIVLKFPTLFTFSRI